MTERIITSAEYKEMLIDIINNDAHYQYIGDNNEWVDVDIMDHCYKSTRRYRKIENWYKESTKNMNPIEIAGFDHCMKLVQPLVMNSIKDNTFYANDGKKSVKAIKVTDLEQCLIELFLDTLQEPKAGEAQRKKMFIIQLDDGSFLSKRPDSITRDLSVAQCVWSLADACSLAESQPEHCLIKSMDIEYITYDSMTVEEAKAKVDRAFNIRRKD